MLAPSGCGVHNDLGLAFQSTFIADQWRLDGSVYLPTRCMVGVDFPGRGQHGFRLCALFLCAFWKSDATIAALQYLEPLITLIIAVVLLGEIVTTISLLGGGLILFGVAWVERSGRA